MKFSELEDKVGVDFALRLTSDETLVCSGMMDDGEPGYHIIDLLKAFEHIIDPDYPLALLRKRKRM